MSLVLDASVVIAWLAQDEDESAADEAMEQLRMEGGWVPSLWSLEIANILIQNVRRGRFSSSDVDDILEDLKKLPLKVDEETSLHAFGGTFLLARKHQLTTYDACYLELAIRKKVPLATLDRALAASAKTEGLLVITTPR